MAPHGDYSHRQFGKAFVVMLVVLMLLLAALYIGVGLHVFVLIPLVLFAVLLLLFHSLLVEVDREELRWSFGIGVIRKRVPIANLRAATAVRNRWWYGLGIRLTPHGWLYNVSGLDAVEIKRFSGKTFRIGTDEPQELVAALRAAIASPPERR